MGALDQRFLVLVNAIIFGCPRLLPRLPTPFVDPIATVLVILFVAVAFLAQGAQIWLPPFVLRSARPALRGRFSHSFAIKNN